MTDPVDKSSSSDGERFVLGIGFNQGDAVRLSGHKSFAMARDALEWAEPTESHRF